MPCLSFFKSFLYPVPQSFLDLFQTIAEIRHGADQLQTASTQSLSEVMNSAPRSRDAAAGLDACSRAGGSILIKSMQYLTLSQPEALCVLLIAIE